jgi:hypothetical protein
MAEKKATLDQLFKHGKDFKFKMVDYSSLRVRWETYRLEKRRKEIHDSQFVDFNDPIMRTPLDRRTPYPETLWQQTKRVFRRILARMKSF